METYACERNLAKNSIIEPAKLIHKICIKIPSLSLEAGKHFIFYFTQGLLVRLHCFQSLCLNYAYQSKMVLMIFTLAVLGEV